MACTRTYLAAAGETRSADSWQMWEALRELAVGRMYDGSQDVGARLIWAKPAIVAGGQRDTSSGSAPASALADGVSVRAYAIREFGAVPGDEIRDASELCETVFRGIGMSRQDVSAEAAAWQELPRDRMLRLRHVKNLLTPLRSIMDTLGPDDPVRVELSAWLALIPELP
ncbi:hypothetical protein [Streptomyces sp. BV129]|uniref:hypothetical protein n=1 Tax=Streptomyces sp. BV129 TaxID=2849671 RepID=UPI001C2F0727|nr:hypothetical protein [Streptomyces sp. BV129]MBV1946362.1 hypothetical protein [Streptomyces sp. BV129]